MKRLRGFFLLTTSVCLILFFLPHGSSGKIYKYRDEKGNWYFTNTPRPDSKGMELIEESKEKKTSEISLAQSLYRKFSPANDIEGASLATVTVKGRMGKGSGFFISDKGHIITNRHVLRGSEAKLGRTRVQIEETEEKIEEAEERLSGEEEHLSRTKRQLDEYKRSIEKIEDASVRELENIKYDMGLERYKAWKEDFLQRKEEFEAKKEEFHSKKEEFNRTIRNAGAERYFEIILKDETRLRARLITSSRKYDLALLKLDRYDTPFLEPGASINMSQGDKVYAIGSPAGLTDSVSSGVISGFEGTYIKTNAHVYPGNSGGPLINQKGEVIGINTFKRLTHKFEGLGFALPIETALDEFGDLVARR